MPRCTRKTSRNRDIFSRVLVGARQRSSCCAIPNRITPWLFRQPRRRSTRFKRPPTQCALVSPRAEIFQHVVGAQTRFAPIAYKRPSSTRSPKGSPWQGIPRCACVAALGPPWPTISSAGSLMGCSLGVDVGPRSTGFAKSSASICSTCDTMNKPLPAAGNHRAPETFPVCRRTWGGCPAGATRGSWPG
jgi:hypothetical protein